MKSGTLLDNPKGRFNGQVPCVLQLLSTATAPKPSSDLNYDKWWHVAFLHKCVDNVLCGASQSVLHEDEFKDLQPVGNVSALIP